MPKCFLSIKLAYLFHSGTIAAALSLIAFFVYTLKLTQRKKWVQLNTALLCVIFILVGFSSWIMLPIRANANTVINENAPADARALLAYYNLEQYPDTHLFYGPMFTDMYAGQDQNTPYVDDKPKYEKDEKQVDILLSMNGKMLESIATANTRAYCQECGVVGTQLII